MHDVNSALFCSYQQSYQSISKILLHRTSLPADSTACGDSHVDFNFDSWDIRTRIRVLAIQKDIRTLVYLLMSGVLGCAALSLPVPWIIFLALFVFARVGISEVSYFTMPCTGCNK